VPRVSPLNSQVAFGSQASGAVCSIADVAEGFHGPCQGRVSFPVRALSLSTFRWLSLADRLATAARAVRPVLIHGSNRIPSG